MKTPDDFWADVKKTDGCWLWQRSRTTSGYGHCKYLGKLFQAHRLAYMLTTGDIPDGMFVCHHCDVRACVRPDHLFLGSPRDNVQDCRAKKRHAHGASAGNAKLTDEQALEIRRRFHAGETMPQLAAAFGVSTAPIMHICHRKMWAHVEDGLGVMRVGSAVGERNWSAKLTAAQVIEIRRCHAEGGVSAMTLASEYHMHPRTINAILSGKAWRHLLVSHSGERRAVVE